MVEEGQFSLYECEELARYLKLPYNRNMLMEGYMVMGGVPYYWTKLNPTMSLGRNIDTLFLNSEGELRDEFNYIYSSMFNTPEKYIRIVQALSGKKSGLTRDEIISKARIDNNGHVSRMLEDLIECGFIRKYCHTGNRLKDGFHLTNIELRKIKTRLNVLRLYAPRSKTVQPVLITSNGTIANHNSFEISLQVTGDQLFMP